MAVPKLSSVMLACVVLAGDEARLLDQLARRSERRALTQHRGLKRAPVAYRLYRSDKELGH